MSTPAAAPNATGARVATTSVHSGPPRPAPALTWSATCSEMKWVAVQPQVRSRASAVSSHVLHKGRTQEVSMCDSQRSPANPPAVPRWLPSLLAAALVTRLLSAMLSYAICASRLAR